MEFNKFVNGKDLIQKAKEFATKCHDGQKRKFNGDDYIIHPEKVAKLVEQNGGSPEQIASAWLHDVLEDCDIDFNSLEKMFGKVVADYVVELTNPKSVERSDKKSEYIAKKMCVMSSGALLIKLCDRLHNVSDFSTAHPNFVKKYAPKTKFILDSLEDCGRPLTTNQQKLVDAIRKIINIIE